ncbi:TetR/AcrR family transcriptional regulator [Demequina oxidasica]|uniref:TetR/AcrR family transcriptional regulator n=1 Tax=Demequina oxidasica TaxID=676199 RepID=UPI000782E338|nr:TetR/AcrR family transcriptional regulator [Demequina oxidasica]
MTVTDIDGGLRERKKAQRRLALHEAAVELFEKNGYDATTVAQIAASAGVSPRTYFSYFPTKEAALFAPLDDAISSLEEALATPPAEGDVLSFLREQVMEMSAHGGPLGPHASRVLDALAAEHDHIVGHALRYLDRIGQALSRALRTELGSADDDALPDIASAAAIAALAASMPVGHDFPHKGTRPSRPSATSVEEIQRDLDRAIEFTRAGLAAMQ